MCNILPADSSPLKLVFKRTRYEVWENLMYRVAEFLCTNSLDTYSRFKKVLSMPLLKPYPNTQQIITILILIKEVSIRL